MKNKILLLVLLTGFTQSAMAQLFSKERLINLENFDKRTLSWGYFLGFNSYDFKFKYKTRYPNNKDIKVKTNFGFNVGLIGDLRINNYLNLRLEPGLSYSRRDLTFPDNNNTESTTKATYIHIPLLLKVSTKRINNFKPFIVGGASTAINLSSKEKSQDSYHNGKYRMTTNPFFYELGFGIDFYFYYFKFTPSIRGVFAITNELVPDNHPGSPTSNIDSMESRAIFINFTFQ